MCAFLRESLAKDHPKQHFFALVRKVPGFVRYHASDSFGKG